MIYFKKKAFLKKKKKEFANEIGAVFELTSSKESIGIDELFEKLGKKYLEKNNLIDNVNENNKKTGSFSLSKENAKNNKGGKKKCCS